MPISKPYYEDDSGVIYHGDCLEITKELPDKSVDLVLTDPPFKRLSNEGATILDPFLGSGTTARACKDLGRKYIGIEIEKKYCDIAVQRLGQEVLF